MFRGSLPSNVPVKDQQSDEAYNSSVIVRPVNGAAWRGKFNISSLNLNINIAAHVSTNACSKVLEVANMMSASLCLEIIPRLDAWPSSFESSPPTECSIALFFFPEERDEDVFDDLLNHTICADFALKSMIGEAELLIFTSLQLPSNLHRFQGKPYFWGVFRGQLGTASHQSDYNVHRARQSISPNSGNHRSSQRKGFPITIPSENSSSTQSSKADRRGRRLDSAWEHAKPLDVSRQKAECKYCGFVSSHGGISRLKVHLGGGIPGIHLPGCGKVPHEVKKLMAEWFGEWLKNTKALWAKEVKEAAGYVAPEHAKPLNVACQRTDYNFSRESLPEGIPLHKAHLGGDQNMHMEPRPQVLTSEWLKSLTPSTSKKSQAGVRPETRGRRLDGAWKHVTPMDEVRQKTRCNYCGFVSQYGGISRLKAHLGGGCPKLQLQGCPHVPLDIKSDMEQWFNEWSRNSAASWIPKSHAASPRSYKGKRPIDDAWEYAILLDETGEATKCKYCGFVSRYEGIARLKAHLAGGDPIMQLEGCPNVPAEIKILMAQGKKKSRKKLKSEPVELLGGILQGTGRTLVEAQRYEIRHHVLQETLDEISNTSVKGRLQKLIEEKNAKLRKMQFEVQTLGMQLASIP